MLTVLTVSYPESSRPSRENVISMPLPRRKVCAAAATGESPRVFGPMLGPRETSSRARVNIGRPDRSASDLLHWRVESAR
jgi:hypothetical protein